MPALAPVVDAIEQVPEGARSFYVPKDGKYVLDLSGTPAGFVTAADLAAANAKVIEFRDTNVNLLKEVEPLRALKTAVGDTPPETIKEALTKAATLGAAGVKDTNDLKTIVEAAVAPFKTQLEQITAQNSENLKRADEATLRAQVTEKFTKAGGEAGATNFIMGEAAKDFVVENGTVKARAGLYSETRPGEPMSVDEWIAKQTKTNAFAFARSGGGGANPAPGGNGLPRTGVVIIKNPTPSQLGDPKLAVELKAGRLRFEYDQ